MKPDITERLAESLEEIFEWASRHADTYHPDMDREGHSCQNQKIVKARRVLIEYRKIKPREHAL